MIKKRLDVQIRAESYDYIKDQSEHNGIPMNTITDELLATAIAIKQGEVIEQQSLPVIREIVQTELRKQLAQQRTDLRDDMALEFTNEFKAVTRASDNRLAALIVRTLRDSSITRRLVYTLIARTIGPDFASKVYEDAKEKAGKELASRKGQEEED
jgi:hypothetical protein